MNVEEQKSRENLLLDEVAENKKRIDSQKTITKRGAETKMGSKGTKAMVIGVGAGGSNVAHLLTPYGYNTVAFNTTMADMTGLDVEVKNTIQGLDGSGKDRQFASTMFKKTYKYFFSQDKLLQMIENNDLIFVVETAGGGTGTILGIMIAGYLKNEYPGKMVILAGMLGSLKEDKTSQQNMGEYLSDVETKAAGCPYMIFDNNRVIDRVGDGVYDVVNREAANAIRFLSKEYMIENNRQNIDGRDYARLMSFGGLMSVTLIDELNVSVTESSVDLEGRVKSAMDKSTALITRYPEAYGIFMNTESEIYNVVDTTFDGVQNLKGVPQSGLVFKHLQNNSNDGPQFGLIMTGLEPPVERLKMIQKRIDEYAKLGQKAKLPVVEHNEGVKLATDVSKKTNSGQGSNFMDGF